jgi:hypothetical protein
MKASSSSSKKHVKAALGGVNITAEGLNIIYCICSIFLSLFVIYFVVLILLEIQTAFNILDLDKTGVLTLSNFRKRVGHLFPDMTAKEFRFLLNNKKEIVINDLKELLLENEILNFDPVTEAFRVIDASNDGFLDFEKFRQTFAAFGFGDLSNEEFEILIKVIFFFIFYIFKIFYLYSLLFLFSKKKKSINIFYQFIILSLFYFLFRLLMSMEMVQFLFKILNQ